jgi:F420-dependent oxidoreductase-like protein
MDIGLMVEGQAGLGWERWLHILRLAERLGFPSLLRSDHYFIGSQQDSLETFISLAVAARETERIRFGPLVSPVTFRHPVDVARMAGQIDLLSGGRLVLGLGNGWNEPEHAAYGLPFPEPAERSRRLEEAIHVMRALWGPGPASYEGRHYRLEGADMLPKPSAGRPHLLIGGSGPKRTLRLAAQHADEWNSVNAPPEVIAERVGILSAHCEAVGRDPATIRKGVMVFAAVGRTQADVEAAADGIRRLTFRGEDLTPAQTIARARERGMLVGTLDEVMERLAGYARAGIDEVQFQHMNFHDDTLPEWLAAEVAPAARSL